MSRPDFVTNEDIARWSEQIDSEAELDLLVQFPLIREVCYAGLWMVEELNKLHCPEEYIVRIQYAAGQGSFGREPWAVHQEFLERYRLGELVFEDDPDGNTQTN